MAGTLQRCYNKQELEVQQQQQPFDCMQTPALSA